MIHQIAFSSNKLLRLAKATSLSFFVVLLSACGAGGNSPNGGGGGGGGGGGSDRNSQLSVFSTVVLWKTDGTSSGTVPVFPGNTAPFTFPYGVTEANGTFYFHANTSANGFELWKTDGTAVGTTLVKDINPGAASAFHYRFADFTVFNGALYFQANDGVNGYELWKSDGTSAGTVMLVDIDRAPGAGSTPTDFTVFNGFLYFSAHDGISGRKLWKTDGTAAGTGVVMDMTIVTGTSYLPDDFARGFPVLNGALYFVGNGVWKTNGPETVLVGDNTAVRWAPALQYGFAVFNGELYFQADENMNNWELFKTDGGPASMVLVKDINTENGGRHSDYLFSRYHVHNGALYFQTKDNVNGPRLWKTNGTTEGTLLVIDLNSSFENFRSRADGLYFTGGAGNSYGLWKSNGTPAGTLLVKDFSS